MLRQPQIKAAVEEADRKIYKKLEITAEKVKQELACIAFSSMMDYLKPNPNQPGEYVVDLDKINVNQAHAIEDYSLDVTGPNRRARIKLAGKIPALQLLGKELGLFGEKLELSSKDGKQLLTVNIIDSIIAGKVTLAQLGVAQDQNLLPEKVLEGEVVR